MPNRSNHPFHLLLVEDNQADADLVKIFVSLADPNVILTKLKDGVEAADFLFKPGSQPASPRPDLILMDLNLPRKDGRSLLGEIKKHPDLCAIPVVMFSTSSSDREVSDSYCLGASAFISKPIDLQRFELTIACLIKFYFKTVRLPSHPVR